MLNRQIRVKELETCLTKGANLDSFPGVTPVTNLTQIVKDDSLIVMGTEPTGVHGPRFYLNLSLVSTQPDEYKFNSKEYVLVEDTNRGIILDETTETRKANYLHAVYPSNIEEGKLFKLDLDCTDKCP